MQGFLHYLLLVLCLFIISINKAFSQENFESEEQEIAEPLFRDNTTDIGSEQGSIELNFIPSWVKNDAFNQMSEGIEIEYTLKEGWGIEAEFSHFSNKLNTGESESKFGKVELGIQHTLWQNTSNAFTIGLETEAPISKEDAWSFAPFATYAFLWSEKLSSQFGLSPEIELEEEAELELAYQASLLYALGDGLVGFELLGSYEEEVYLAIAPQMSWSWGDFSVGGGLQLPLINGTPGEIGFLLRFIYEIEKD